MFSTSSLNKNKYIETKISSLNLFSEVMLESVKSPNEKKQISERFDKEISEIKKAAQKQDQFANIASKIIEKNKDKD
ncbi:hypothetical protein NEPTK9_001230 [Candidatus Neptunochlamydia vexilliferae]|uniref:Uncharacterized protein n=2 Tax=Candidatus Neptunichlamydia vexilliferae TaxID=1651774 RepID=A0ABS0B009_9BACT|nr:hypothetical protein [Candidatus Neptunochlamydia vexilliferae]